MKKFGETIEIRLARKVRNVLISQMPNQYDCIELRAKKILKAFFVKAISKMEYQDRIFLCYKRLEKLKDVIQARK